jgi:6-phosphogluconate dehydrogenase
MGQNLALNIESRGFTTAIFNRSPERTKALMDSQGRGRRLLPAYSIGALIRSLGRPRRMILMVKAGAGVDETLAHLLPHLGRGDIVLDGGNSHFRDTDRRAADLAKRGIRFMGCGISGGEEGALKGPSIMPGGDRAAWKAVAPVLRAIAARTEDGPCVTHLGAGSAGHFVKMVHNGIEYGMMQILAETYDLIRHGLGWSVEAAQRQYASWSEGRLGGYLVEITATVLKKTDEATGRPLVELILDSAAQKGTGKWTTEAALDLGVPVPTITTAVEARVLSGHKQDRLAIARTLPARPRKAHGLAPAALEQACHAAFLIAYAQGMHLLVRASREKSYGLNPAEVARIWKGGCIIRSRLLDLIRTTFKGNPKTGHLFMARPFARAVRGSINGLRRTVSAGAAAGIPVPALASALAYADAFGRERLPANLTQAQRDLFGAHTYARTDKPGTFHTQW